MQDWIKIEKKFHSRWNFSNCLGAVDGKHINITQPPNSSTLFHNHKGFFSIVLMALAHPDYRFIYIDVGDYGSNCDSAIFKNCNFGKAYMYGNLDIPPPKKLHNIPAGQGEEVPYCIVGDEVFSLQCDLMRPYPKGQRGTTLSPEKQMFNYRLSRARRIVENCFGILAQRFRIYDRRMYISDITCQQVVKATCALHKFLTEPKKDVAAVMARLNPDGHQYMGPNGAIQPLPHLHGYHSPNAAIRIRDIYKDYFQSPYGAVPWQRARAVLTN